MQNSLFDDLKNLKNNMKENEKIENDKRIEEEKARKEKKLKDEFLEFVKDSGIKKIG
ncbi:MAG: hypothetical protein R3331_01990 [Sulfurospirillaceae bacterium]|nr:hypothetical protein [Sulfurospirillaceae bacterium]